MKSEIITEASRLREIHDDWAGLVSSLPDSDACLLPEWFFAWWEVFSAEKSLLFIALWEQSALCALAPFFTTRNGPFRVLHFMGHPFISDRMDVLVLPGREKEALDAVAKCLHDRNEWDMIYLRQFSPISGNADRLAGALRDLGFRTILREDGPCRYIDLKQYDGFEGYLNQTFSRTKRRNLDRKARRLNEAGKVTWDFVHTLDEHLVAEMIDLDVNKSYRGKIGKSFLQNPLHVEFLKKIAFHLGPERFLLDTVRVNGALVAYSLAVGANNKAGNYQSAHHMDYGKVGSGVQIMIKSIEHAFELGLDEFDFLLGDEDYKSRYAPLVRVNRRLRSYRGGIRSWLPGLYYERCLPLWQWIKKTLLGRKKKAAETDQSAND